MTASQVIRQIERLSAEEQAEVIRFAYQLDAERQLSGSELSALAGRMAKATDPEHAAALREEIVRGFYGKKGNA